MSKKAKLLEKLRNNPKGIRFEEIDLILISFGFTRRQPSGGSSHYIYHYGNRWLTIARHIPFIHFGAVKDALDILDEIIAEHLDSETQE
jgi:hypothetical protein